MDRIMEAVKKTETVLAVIFIAGIVVLVFVAALLRWFGVPIAWSIDVALLLFGWVVFLGADVALKNDSHIGVDMFVNMLPAAARRIIKLVIYFIILVFLVFVGFFGFNLSVANYERLFNTLQISYSYATLSVPVGSLLMILTVITKIRGVIKTGDRGTDPGKAAW